jgi:predicted glutamine amidotransferase
VLDAHEASATLNLVVSDGDTIVAARHSVRAPFNSLYVAGREDAHLAASEPLDESSDRKPVPEAHLVSVTATSLTVSPLA